MKFDKILREYIVLGSVVKTNSQTLKVLIETL